MIPAKDLDENDVKKAQSRKTEPDEALRRTDGRRPGGVMGAVLDEMKRQDDEEKK